jgi:hypothetical protein
MTVKNAVCVRVKLLGLVTTLLGYRILIDSLRLS